jgi:predicted transcriptional regulator
MPKEYADRVGKRRWLESWNASKRVTILSKNLDKVKEVFRLDLSRVLASSLRQKMLRELAATKELQVMRLVSKTNSTYNEINRNLQILEKEGIITNTYPIKTRHGKVRIIRLNKENPKT